MLRIFNNIKWFITIEVDLTLLKKVHKIGDEGQTKTTVAYKSDK